MLTSDFIRTGGNVWTRAQVGGGGAGDDDQFDPGNYVNTPSFLGVPLVGRTAGVGTASVSDARTAGVAQMVSLTNTPMGSRQHVPYSTTTAGHIANAGAFADPSGANINTAYQFGTFGAEYTFDDDDDDATPNFLHAQALAAAFGAATAGGTGVVTQLQGSNVAVVVAINGVDVINLAADDINVADPNGNWQVNRTVAGVTSPPVNAGAGFNQFAYGVVQIFEGDIVTIFTTTAEAYEAAAGNEPGIAQYNFATTANAWVFVRDTATPIQNGDVDMDGDVDRDDFNVIVAGFPTNSFNSWGDFDGDSDVEVDDLDDLIAAGYPSGAGQMLPPSTLQEGDADHDGDVDKFDFEEWLGNAPANILLVSEESDVVDSNYTFEHLSLREALAIADDGDTILFAPWVDEITLGGTQLTVADDVTIIGPGADELTIDANHSNRVFTVSAGVDAAISGMTITGGGNVYTGGGILNNGNLTLENVVITGNTTTAGGFGGGVLTQNGSTGTASLWLINSTVDGNHAMHGSGLYLSVVGGDVEIVGSTISNNIGLGLSTSTYSAGGGIAVDGSNTGSIEIENSTFSGNQALFSGAIRLQNSQAAFTMVNSTVAYNIGNESGGLQRLNNTSAPILHNTIIAENTDHATGAKKDINGSVDTTNSTYNLIGSGGSGGLTNGVNNNIVLTSLQNAGLAPLGDYGGKTKTHALKTGSLAIDKGSDATALASDQRGYDREYDLAGVSDGADGFRDIGAYEAGLGTTLIVRSDGDRNNSINDKVTTDSLRLREALALAVALAGNEVISFDESLYAAAPAHIVLSYDGPDGGNAPDSLSIGVGGVTIAGPGAGDVIIDGNDLTRVIFINVTPGDEPILFEGVTITGGAVDVGAGIWIKAADVTLRGVRVVDNAAANVGGGIYSENVERLLILSSEISENTAGTTTGAGGGIYDVRELDSEPGLQIVNSTISSNSAAGASGKGGGLYLYRDADSSTVLLPIINSTIAFNTAASGGGIYSTTVTGSAFVQIRNSIVADNVNLSSVANNVAGLNFNSGTYNLIGLGGSGGLVDNVNNNIVLSGAETSGLKALGYYGGSTKTHALRYDSVAIDAGFDDFADDWDLESDQRGVDRISDSDYGIGDGIDIGALELAISEYHS